MKDLSIDLETMGTKAGCPIISIRAVYFDPMTGETGNEFFDFPLRSRPWGNGATFDVSILEHALGATGRPASWKFWEIRDVRTIVDVVVRVDGFDLRGTAFEGEKHNALDDAKHQAKMVSRGYAILGDNHE